MSTVKNTHNSSKSGTYHGSLNIAKPIRIDIYSHTTQGANESALAFKTTVFVVFTTVTTCYNCLQPQKISKDQNFLNLTPFC
jgi:hypothetical protein